MKAAASRKCKEATTVFFVCLTAHKGRSIRNTVSSTREGDSVYLQLASHASTRPFAAAMHAQYLHGCVSIQEPIYYTALSHKRKWACVL